MIVQILRLFAAMLIAHALCDYPLQGDFLAKAKNRFAPIPGVPWYQALAAHAAIHAGAVWLLTGSALLAAAELIAHATIDDLKCAGQFSFNLDQLLHAECKLLWAVMAVEALHG